MNFKYLLIPLMTIAVFACKEKQKSTSATEEKKEDVPTYFSITGYFEDQWNTRRGNPYVLLRIVTLNGKTDSAFVNLDSTLWYGLRAKFDAADISDKKFLDQYNFNMFPDETTGSNHLYYEAKTPELFMRKMDIGADQVTDLVKSVYLETRLNKGDMVRSQKLQYVPDRFFQIQEFESSPGAPDKNLRMEYHFQY